MFNKYYFNLFPQDFSNVPIFYTNKELDYLKDTYIYQDVRKSLEEELANKMYSAFSNQLKRLIPKYQKKFRTEFEDELKKLGATEIRCTGMID